MPLFDFDQFYMQQAMMLARRGLLTVSPNPAVGCVIVKNGQIIGEGYHRQSGGAHAEIYALRQAKNQAKGATVYVTLEPCCHYGRTAPCVAALIAAQVARVVVGTLDPNPQVAGKGIQALQARGIATRIGVLQDSLYQLNAIFFHYHRTQKPWIVAKWAMSLDGKIAVNDGDDKQISNLRSQQITHDWRNRCDAILIGAKTLCDDDPSLIVRHSQACIIKHPLRVVVCHDADALPLQRQLYDTQAANTLIACTQISGKRKAYFDERGVKVYCMKDQANVDLNQLFSHLGQQGITSVLVEGGMTIHRQLAQLGLINQTITFIAPCMIGNTAHKQWYAPDTIQALDDNVMMVSHQGEQPYV